jgi:hypothetical protein
LLRIKAFAKLADLFLQPSYLQFEAVDFILYARRALRRVGISGERRRD